MNKVFIAALAIIAAQQVSAQCISGNCQDGYGTYQDAKGRYTGFFANRLPNGYGVMNRVSGESYIGQFVDGKFAKDGTYFFSDGTRYTGNWQAGQRQGKGVEISPEGKVYTDYYANGDFVDDFTYGPINGDTKNGWGVMVYEDGKFYEGYFKKGLRDGYGKLTNTDGSIYEGEFTKDLYDGYGELSHPDGNTEKGMYERGRYIGELKNQFGCVSGDCYSTYSVQVDKEGTYYGEFRNGQRHGMGKLVEKSGITYKGSFVNGARDGYATITYTKGLRPDSLVKYIGDVKNGNPDGYGAMMYSDGSLYYGHISNFEYSGQGVYVDMQQEGRKKSGIWRDGQLAQELEEKELDLVYGSKNGYGIKMTDKGLYQGNLELGQPSGRGMMNYYTGVLYVGDFDLGKANGDGMSDDPNTGTKYFGEFLDDAMTGHGTMFMADGTKLKGNFRDGKLSKESITASIPKPQVSWSAPQSYITNTNESQITVKLCVSSRVDPDEVTVWVNGVVKGKKANKSYQLVNSQCDYSYEFTLDLNLGRNEIKAVVKNEGGQSASDLRLVNYEPGDVVQSQKRVALVIGNSDYQNVTKLKNASNDAKLMTTVLKEIGFEVITAVDADRITMRDKVYEFGDKLAAEKAVGLFFYAGHGLQVDGVNYLVPITANITRRESVDEECFSIEKVLGQMTFAKNDLNIVILDACRNNPFANTTRAIKSNDGGLAQINAPKGTFIAFSTSPGKTAADGDGDNGLYTEQLAKAIKHPGWKIEDVFKQVRNEVYRISSEKGDGNEQIPWENSSIFTDFYFVK